MHEPDGPPRSAEPVVPPERQRVVDRLCAHFAADHLDTEEFERRLDLAWAARTRAELEALERGLPLLAADPGGAVPAPAVSTAVAPAPAIPAIDASRPVRESEFMVAVMGGTERSGSWIPARRIRVLAVMGGAELDFREALFACGEVEVTIAAVMGGAEIIVPPGIHVESSGMAILGGFGSADPARPVAPGAPVLRIRGLALMGGVEVTERLPGETERQARKRRRAERKGRTPLPPPTPPGV